MKNKLTYLIFLNLRPHPAVGIIISYLPHEVVVRVSSDKVLNVFGKPVSIAETRDPLSL